jgi:radical SAM superfamily enzyme YgiQ (UPF0313 family)
MRESKVLVITGSFLIDERSTFLSFIKKQIAKIGFGNYQWLEHRIKTLVAEVVLPGEIDKRHYRKNKSPNTKLNDFFKKRKSSDSPYLTEVLLTTLLNQENIKYTQTTYDELFTNPKKLESVINDCDVVFVSSTYLKDLSELLPVIKALKRKHNKLVVGGALAGSIYKQWDGDPDLDVLAIGYGEYLVPAIARWIKDNFKELLPPIQGRVIQKQNTKFLFSGVPENLSLDSLTVPDWSLSQYKRNVKYNMIYYESVRGCPYRCAFCNYPYLFDDTKFRMKSAEKIAEDWEYYTNELQIEFITCLDSLFTMPKQRLIKFCNLLIEKNIEVKWSCYARADDLCDEEVVILLKKSGCIQVQIGIESGDPTLLENMNKKLGVDKNKLALTHCRKYNLTTVISIIVGFPGETKSSIQNTLNFLKASPPDFYFLVVFSVRVMDVPILSEKNRERFGIRILDSMTSMSPYWEHSTMNCMEATQWVSYLTDEIIKNKVSLDAALFQKEILYYDPTLRGELLEFQKKAWENRFLTKRFFGILNFCINFFLRRDLHLLFSKSSP